jgi:hypothetical protein
MDVEGTNPTYFKENKKWDYEVSPPHAPGIIVDQAGYAL